jgi:hypothetical protein
VGIRFENTSGGLILRRPDGRPFETFVELNRRADEAERRAGESERRAAALAERLRALGVDPEAV